MLYSENQKWDTANKETAGAEKQVAELKANRKSKLSTSDVNNIKPGTSGLWERVCGRNGINVFEVEVRAGEGLALVARRAIAAYFNALAFSAMPATTIVLTPEEKTYAEDYITAKLIGLQGLKLGEKVKVECKLVEEATIKARLLTINQKQNLKQFSEGVTDFQILKMIQDVINQTSVPGGLKPIIITPR